MILVFCCYICISLYIIYTNSSWIWILKFSPQLVCFNSPNSKVKNLIQVCLMSCLGANDRLDRTFCALNTHMYSYYELNQIFLFNTLNLLQITWMLTDRSNLSYFPVNWNGHSKQALWLFGCGQKYCRSESLNTCQLFLKLALPVWKTGFRW